jgi:hypothetical protein
VTLGIGNDDGVRVWFNGPKVHDIKGGRQAKPEQDIVKAHVKRGGMKSGPRWTTS